MKSEIAMHIDFAPPSGGTYNNAGSSRQLVSYMEHEDLERMEKGIYTDGFSTRWRGKIYMHGSMCLSDC